MPGLATLLLVALVAVIVVLSAIVARDAVCPPRHTAGYAVAHGLAMDPGEPGFEFEAWTLAVAGAELPVWEIQGSGVRGQGSGEASLTAVFLHDWGQSRIDVLAGIKPWDELCDRLVLYDLRGHGDAEGGVSRLGCGDERDLVALLERLGEGNIVLVGHGLGAVIAISAVATDGPAPKHIAGVVAYGPYCDFHTTLRGRLRAAGLPARPLSDLAVLWLALFRIRPPRLDRQVKHVRYPLLVIHGSEDPIAPFSDAEQIAEAVPDAVLHAVQDAGHLDLRMADPASHDEAVRRFVERCETRAACRRD